MEGNPFMLLRDSILNGNCQECYQILQHPRLNLKELLDPNHKEWYFVVLENHLDKINRNLDKSHGDTDEKISKIVQVSLKLANEYARREQLLDSSMQKINSIVLKDIKLATISILIEENENLGGIINELLGTLTIGEIKHSTQLRLRAAVIHDELYAATKEKGTSLTYEEMLTILRIVYRVFSLNEAISCKDDQLILQILKMKDAFWENLTDFGEETAGTYMSRLRIARDKKTMETGRSIRRYF